MNQRELGGLWFSSRPTPGAAFGLIDSVRITSGEYAGEFATVTSLAALEPTPRYIVEPGSGGGDVAVAEYGLGWAV
jgi:hypothetical protein